MFGFIVKLSNLNAIPVTEKLQDRDYKNFILGYKPDLKVVAKDIYTKIVKNISGLDEETRNELFFYIKNLEFDEHRLVSFFKTRVWKYNFVAEKSIYEYFYNEERKVYSNSRQR